MRTSPPPECTATWRRGSMASSAPLNRQTGPGPPRGPGQRPTTMPANHEDPTQLPIDVQRVLMDRARSQAVHDGERLERPLLPRLLGMGLALVVVVVVLFAFDRFLASMQRFLDLPVGDPEPAATEPVVTEPPVTDPMPAYVVPEE